MKVIKLKCESDKKCFDQEVRKVEVIEETKEYWKAKPLANKHCPPLLWPKFAWKEVR